MDDAIPLMIDASVLKQVPKFNSELFNELVKYTRAGLYSLYISEIVEKEFISWVKAEAQGAFDAVTKATRSLNKYYDESSILGLNFEFNVTALAAENQINGILRKVEDNWAQFKQKTNATIIPVEPHHGKRVMDSYFCGETPFSGVKNRNDIPDAFIYCSIKDILEENEKVVFVSGDKKFCEQVQGERVMCFESLSKLFSDGPAKMDARFFRSLSADDKFFALVTIYEDEIHEKLVQEIEVTGLDDIVGNEFVERAVGEYKDMVTNVIEIDKRYKDAQKTSDLAYLVSFEAKLKCAVESHASKEQLGAVEEERLKNIEKEVDDDGDFNVTEKRLLSVSGHFSLKFEDSDPSAWKKVTTSRVLIEQSEIKEISVELEDMKENA